MSSMSRRDFLLGLAAIGLLPITARAAPWSNWSGNQQANPSQWIYATDEDAVVAAVRSNSRLRVVGGSHSFSALVPTDGALLSLDGLSGLIEHDGGRHQATLWAGTRLMQAGEALAGVGQSLMNEPDINLQSLGGTISTAVHGTGRTLHCLSAYVRGLRLVTARGDVLDCSAEQHPELFEAARVGLGSLGVITRITLQNAPLYRVRETVEVLDLEEALAAVDAAKDQHRHIEFLAFLDAEEAIVKRHDIVDEPEHFPSQEDDNPALDLAADTARRWPWLNRWLQELVGVLVEPQTRVGEGWKVFASPRTIPFNEMEYQVPAEVGLQCFNEIRAAIRQSGIQVFFPIEFRYVKGDDLWLSPFHGRDSVSISVHQYHKQDYRPLFALVEPIFQRYAGRPHWGKLHTLTAADLAPLYPRWDDFQRVRREADPEGKFMNAHVRTLFGEAGSA